MRRALMLLALPASAILSSAALAQGVPIYAAMTDLERDDLCNGGDGQACGDQGERALLAQQKSETAPENFGRPAAEQPKAEGRKAVAYLEKSCAAGYSRGCLMLAIELLEGRYVAAARERGVQLLDRECKQHKSASACRSLASYYAVGKYGLPQDPALSRLYDPTVLGPGLQPNSPLKPKNRSSWIPQGWESASFREAMAGQAVSVTFTIMVGLDGRPDGCSHDGRTVAEKLFGSEMCAVLKKRARFEPATDGNGNPKAAAYSLPLRWG